MKAMLLESPGRPLRVVEVETPQPAAGQVLLRVKACGVCRTDLHVVDGELPRPKLPLIPGHEVVGVVEALGAGVTDVALGDRLGVPWLGWTCGECPYCRRGQENLCDRARFTGYGLDGGYAEYLAADRRCCFPIPAGLSDEHAAPLLCAGLIGYRSFAMTGDAQKLGFYGFGAAAHILIQVATAQRREVFAFTRPADAEAQDFARKLGAIWAGDSDQVTPDELDAAIIFAPVGGLVPTALRAVRKGGLVVCAGIHMSDIPSFPYEILWGERIVRSVANLTRRDGIEFMELLKTTPVRTEIETYPLEQANQALSDLREGRVHGAAVLVNE
ncbi:MAG TPA: zinc-dependent alcohol dehydrogenase family protein [Pirellulales bacterium]|nr:zinc-dependent alcohol dehydrogenase family protein [Pirellulales bacterium]